MRLGQQIKGEPGRGVESGAYRQAVIKVDHETFDEVRAKAAREALRRAIETHQKAGRRVRVFQNRWGGKDLNDALRAARGAEKDGRASA